MNFKKTAAFVLSLTMLGSTSAFTAFAEDEPPVKTYDYVALGDSIAAGFGLSKDENGFDRAVILSKDLIANPVQEAYPAVFGNYLAQIGEDYGYEVTATNLSTTAYRAEDITHVLKESGFVSPVGAGLAQLFTGDNAQELMAAYHDIFEEYIPEAELVSVELGGNDVIQGAFKSLRESENPILAAAGTALMLSIGGMSLDKIATVASQQLENQKDNIDRETIMEAFQYFMNSSENIEELIAQSTGYVKEIVELVKEKNPDADVAVINQFNPYISEYDYVEAYHQIISEVFREAIEEVFADELPEDPEETEEDEQEYEVPEREITEEAIDEANAENHRIFRRLKVLLNEYKEQKQDFEQKLDEVKAKELRSLLDKMTERIGYPYLYTVMNQTADPYIQQINDSLFAVCYETGAIYVDTYYWVTPDGDSDPHPNAEGHRQIATAMYYTLEDHIASSMEEPPVPAPTFERQNLTLGGDIAVNFYLDLSCLTEEEKENCYMEFTVAGKTTTDEFDPDDMNQTGEYYGFTCKVPSVGMADEITAVLHYGDEKTVTKTYSVEKYLSLFNENDSTKLLNMIHAINDYGYHAQKYLSKNAETPWTIGVEHQAMEKAYKYSYSRLEINSMLKKIQDKKIVKNLNEDIKKVSYALVLDSDTAISLYVTPANDYEGDVTITVDGVPAEAKLQEDGRYAVTIGGISPKHLGSMHNVEITTENGTSTVDVSALSYVYECLAYPLSKEETNAMASLYRYYAATLAYFK